MFWYAASLHYYPQIQCILNNGAPVEYYTVKQKLVKNLAFMMALPLLRSCLERYLLLSDSTVLYTGQYMMKILSSVVLYFTFCKTGANTWIRVVNCRSVCSSCADVSCLFFAFQRKTRACLQRVVVIKLVAVSYDVWCVDSAIRLNCFDYTIEPVLTRTYSIYFNRLL